METRYYFIFAIVVIVLQCLLAIFNRTLRWLWVDKHCPQSKKWLTLALFTAPNAVLICHVAQFFTAFRFIALMLTLLLFSAFVSVVIGFLRVVLKKSKNFAEIDRLLRFVYPVGLAGLIGLSLYNAYVPRVVHYNIQFDKPMKPLRIGVASDLHLGVLFGAQELDKLAQIMTEQKVDLILLPGDIMDDNVDAYLAENMRPHLAKLQAPLGVYATLGNHDFFGHQDEISDEIRKAGITLLQDQTRVINNEFVLIGRNDDLNTSRPTTEMLLKQADLNLPIIVLDHRPSEVDIHSALPFDLQVSGHTHKGQIFPANLITGLLYRIDYGLEKIGTPYFMVTSGFGFWGIPMRLGSQSEVVILDVKGKN